MPDPRSQLLEIVAQARALADREARRHPHARVLTARPLDPDQSPDGPAVMVPAGPGPGLQDHGEPGDGEHRPGGPQPRPPFAGNLGDFETQIQECRLCPLGATRKHFVFGQGNPKASLVFVGEAPGAEEDAQGRPFVGAAGRLLTKIISAMGFKREEVYICNLLKCRPPGNRDPLPGEAAACRPFVEHQISLIRPRVICALGRFASQALLDTDEGIQRLRGRRFEWKGIPVYPTFHPSALLRDESLKKHVWEDMKLVMKELGGH